ncbi:MAG: preprotein translocase subunit YajC [Candidatus Cloacimonetes bacterium]|nr:preprotein translocase subunit YajC [Candidatus Cloacimonadota bacterium]
MASSLIFFGALFAIMYFLMIRPQQKRQKEMQKMLESLQVNDKVITSSGIYGRVVSIKPDKDIVVIEIDDTNKVRVDFQRSAIVNILNITKTEG